MPLQIDIYCGASQEEWSPKSEATGIGGSEEAVINISRELAKLGNKVTVWNKCGDDEGDYNGVKYENYEYFEKPKDVVIYWRNPEYPVKFGRAKKKTVLWLHDAMPEYSILPVKYLVDDVFVLSTYHANLYPHLKDKTMITSNGINLEHFNQKVKRNPKKIVYGSSYDRGLKELLEMWSEIKLAEPEAELTYFYGKGGLEKAGYDDFIEYIEELSNQEGVTCLDRISHEEVAKEFLSAGVWAYPAWFPEISAITAMKAQTGGAIPVITPTAALVETVRWGYTTREPRDEKGQLPWGTKMPDKLMDEFVRLTIKALNPNNQSFRRLMMNDAERFSWDKIAQKWDKYFRRQDG